MAQNEIGQFDEIDNNNVDITSVTVVQNQMYPFHVDNAFRNLMGALKRWFKTSLFRLRDSTDQTKLAAFDLSAISPTTTRTYAFPNADGTIFLNGSQSLALNPTTTTPAIAVANAVATSVATATIQNNLGNGFEFQTVGSTFATATRFNTGAGNSSLATNTGLNFGTIAANDLQFFTGNTYRGRWINSSGYFLVGATTSSFATVEAGMLADPNGGLTLKRAGTGAQSHIVFGNNAAVSPASVGSITTTGSTTTYNTASDGRLKPIREDFDAGALIDALVPVRHNWKDFPDQWSYGVIAQDAFEVVPVAVNVGSGDLGGDDFTPWSVDYSKFVPIILREVKDLRARLSALEGK